MRTTIKFDNVEMQITIERLNEKAPSCSSVILTNAPDRDAHVANLELRIAELQSAHTSLNKTLADQVKYTESLLADRAKQNDKMTAQEILIADARRHRDILNDQLDKIRTLLGATVSESAIAVAERVSGEQSKASQKSPSFDPLGKH